MEKRFRNKIIIIIIIIIITTITKFIPFNFKVSEK